MGVEKIELELKDAIMEVSVAQRDYETKTDKYNAARKDQTESINRLNSAQKKVDSLMAKMKSLCGGDWAKSKGVDS